MTTPSKQQARQDALDDVADIEALEKSQAFNRYFVGRLNKRYGEAIEAMKRGKTQEDREAARQRALLLEELSNMRAEDRRTAENLLRTPLPSQRGPVQVG